MPRTMTAAGMPGCQPQGAGRDEGDEGPDGDRRGHEQQRDGDPPAAAR